MTNEPTVERYDHDDDGHGWSGMRPHTEGDYVEFKDYEQLQKENDDLAVFLSMIFDGGLHNPATLAMIEGLLVRHGTFENYEGRKSYDQNLTAKLDQVREIAKNLDGYTHSLRRFHVDISNGGYFMGDFKNLLSTRVHNLNDINAQFVEALAELEESDQS